MKLVGMNVVPARHFCHHRLGRQALLHNPQLLSRRPPPLPLRTGKHRHRHRVCPLICKSMSKALTWERDPIAGLHRMPTLYPPSQDSYPLAGEVRSKVPVLSEALEAEPTETNILLSSCESAMSRVQWPRPVGNVGTMTSGFPFARRSPVW